MSDPDDVSMFDYDSRPVTPQIVLVDRGARIEQAQIRQ